MAKQLYNEKDMKLHEKPTSLSTGKYMLFTCMSLFKQYLIGYFSKHLLTRCCSHEATYLQTEARLPQRCFGGAEMRLA